MTVLAQHRLACDWPGCRRRWLSEPSASTANLEAVVLRDAENLGWSRRAGNDFCPHHDEEAVYFAAKRRREIEEISAERRAGYAAAWLLYMQIGTIAGVARALDVSQASATNKIRKYEELLVHRVKHVPPPKGCDTWCGSHAWTYDIPDEDFYKPAPWPHYFASARERKKTSP